ncbi:unnamed protein product [Coccothraustes coccothraustes]
MRHRGRRDPRAGGAVRGSAPLEACPECGPERFRSRASPVSSLLSPARKLPVRPVSQAVRGISSLRVSEGGTFPVSSPWLLHGNSRAVLSRSAGCAGNPLLPR